MGTPYSYIAYILAGIDRDNVSILNQRGNGTWHLVLA
jgi:hypothetical protein